MAIVSDTGLPSSFPFLSDLHNVEEFVKSDFRTYLLNQLRSMNGLKADDVLWWDQAIEIMKKEDLYGAHVNQILDVMAVLSPDGVPERFLKEIIFNLDDNDACDKDSRQAIQDKRFKEALSLLEKLLLVYAPLDDGPKKHLGETYVLHRTLRELRVNEMKQERYAKHVISVAVSMTRSKRLASFKDENCSVNIKNLEQICKKLQGKSIQVDRQLKLDCARMMKTCSPKTVIRLLRPMLRDELRKCNMLSKFKWNRVTGEIIRLLSSSYVARAQFEQAVQLIMVYQSQVIGMPRTLEFELLRILGNASYCRGDYRRALFVYLSAKKLIQSGIFHGRKKKIKWLNFQCDNIMTVSAFGYSSCDGCLKRLKKMLENNSGPQSMIYSTLSNFAQFYLEHGSLQKALDYAQKAYQNAKQMFGKEHPNSVEQKLKFAFVLFKLGNFKKALKKSEKAYEIQCNYLGNEDPITLKTKSYIALYYAQASNMEKSILLAKEAYEILARDMGTEHLHTLESARNYASILCEFGKFRTAHRVISKVYQTQFVNIFGWYNSSFIHTLNIIGNILFNEGKYHKSLLMRQWLCKMLRTLTASDANRLLCLNNIAECQLELGRSRLALQMSKAVHDAQVKQFGHEDLQTLATVRTIAKCESKLGSTKAAVIHSRRVYIGLSKILGEDHPRTLRSLSELISYSVEDRPSKDVVNSSQDAYEKVCYFLGENNSVSLSSQDILAKCQSKIGNKRIALIISKSANKNYIDQLGFGNPATINSIKNTVRYELAVGNFSAAEGLLEQIFKPEMRKLGPADVLKEVVQSAVDATDDFSISNSCDSAYEVHDSYQNTEGLSDYCIFSIALLLKQIDNLEMRSEGSIDTPSETCKIEMDNSFRNQEGLLDILKDVYKAQQQENDPEKLSTQAKIFVYHIEQNDIIEVLVLAEVILDELTEFLKQELKDGDEEVLFKYFETLMYMKNGLCHLMQNHGPKVNPIQDDLNEIKGTNERVVQLLSSVQTAIKSCGLIKHQRRMKTHQSPYLHWFDPIRYLGCGAFGIVFEAKKKIEGIHYAVKRITLPPGAPEDYFMREFLILARLSHKNIVKYYHAWFETIPTDWEKEMDPLYVEYKENSDYKCQATFTLELKTAKDVKDDGSKNKYEDGSNGVVYEDLVYPTRKLLYIQQELCQESLQNWLISNKSRPKDLIFEILQQISDAVTYIHRLKIIHRDLKPGNIFISKCPQISLRLGDFGLAKLLDESPVILTSHSIHQSVKVTNHGTKLYMSPERKEGGQYDDKDDIYALGIIFLELLQPIPPDALKMVLENIRIGACYQDFFYEIGFIKAMTDKNPGRRPSAFKFQEWLHKRLKKLRPVKTSLGE